MVVLSTQPFFALWRDWWDEPRTLKNWNSTYKKPSIPSVEPPILGSKCLCFAMQWPSKGQPANSFARQIESKQKLLDQVIYLLNILATKKYQIKIPLCNMNQILTNLRKWGRISERNSAFLSTSCTSPIGRHSEFHPSETWRHTGSDDSTNNLLGDAPSLLYSSLQRTANITAKSRSFHSKLESNGP